MKGKSVYFLKATDISKYAASQFSNEKEMQSEAHRAIRSAHTCQLLLIDDIGKGRLSPAAEELLYDILDKRSEKQLPIIWTANSTAEQLHDMMSADRGDAIMRRLGEFTKVISI
jgi:DNA replication protein DnaC